MLLTPDEMIACLPIQVTAYQSVVSPFDDATHCVYKLNALQGKFALKLLRDTPSTFWRGMNALFDVKLSQQVQMSAQHYACAADYFSVTVPSLVASQPTLASSPAYLLTAWLKGEVIHSEQIPTTLIESLAVADAQRHQKKRATWGNAIEPGYSLEDWRRRIAALLPQVSPEALAKVMETDGFVPMIMDMRWDQCLQQDGRLSALVDIDALVFAPKALELVLMEYWLTPEQLAVWSLAYLSAGGDLPSLAKVRKTYRQLLWSWHIMGRLTEDEWMAWPEFFA